MENISGRRNPSVLSMILTTVLLLGLGIFGIIALSTGDWLWFWPRFDEQPDRIILHCYGRDLAYLPGNPIHLQLTALMNRSLSNEKRWDSLTMSETTYRDYLSSSQMMTLEYHYAQPVRVHSNFRFFSGVDTMVLPLDGRHAWTNPIFALKQGRITAGSLHIESNQPLLDYIRSQGLCQKP